MMLRTGSGVRPPRAHSEPNSMVSHSSSSSAHCLRLSSRRRKRWMMAGLAFVFAGAWFGSIPDMAGGPEKGVLFSGVSTGSPAEKAGLKAGDVLVRIGDNEITDLQAMTDVLRTYRPGDSTTVVVLREGKEVSVPLTFAARNR